MHALVPAGGVGSRLRPYTVTVPKPLLPLGDVPIIEVLLRQLAHQGFTRVTVAVGHLAGLVAAFCGDGARWGITIDYVMEEEPEGTAGALARVHPGDDRLLVVNGDTLTDFDMGAACRAHDPADAMTVVAARRPLELEFGVIDTDGAGRLTGYEEKPTLGFLAGVGIYVVSAWAIASCLPHPERIDMPGLIHRLIEAGHPIRVRPTDAFWLDLGRPGDLDAAARAFAAEPERFLPA